MKTPLDQLTPALREWFTARFPGLTEIQRRALPHTLNGENTLILAPTGSGKTLSAFLSCLSALRERALTGTLPNAVCVIYVSPLRSLDRDIHRNLASPLDAINADLPEKQQIRMDVRTGDTSTKERGKQQRRRPHLLLTTPESLSAICSQVGWREGLSPFCVIVDEIHAFAESKRGTLLALTLERLEARALDGKLQRIGLSATAAPISAVTELLTGLRPCAVAQVDMKRAFSLDIALPSGRFLPAAGFNPLRVADVAAKLVLQANASLVFTSVRAMVEKIGLSLQILLPEHDERIAVHHGSVDRATREEVEAGLAEGRYLAVVCSSSLELGVDFPAVDQVIMIGSPKGVSRTLQRLGRSGHRINGVARGILVPLNAVDLLECIAIRRATATGHLDLLRIPHAPLDVLAQVLLGMAVERSWYLDEAYELVCRAGPYADLMRGSFDIVIDYLAGGGRVLSNYDRYGKIIVESGQFQVASARIAREYYLNVGVISDDVQVRVVTRKNQSLGTVEEGFISSLQPDEAFVIGGKVVALETLHQTTAIVKPAVSDRVIAPRWGGQKMSLSSELASEELALRRALRDAWQKGGREAALALLTTEWKTSTGAADQLVRFLDRQYHAAPIPIDTPVQVEIVPDGRSRIVQFHIIAGRAVNRSLGWVVGHRLSGSSSVMANHDDHGFLLSFGAKNLPDEEQLREAFQPDGFPEVLERIVNTTETLGRGFRSVAETGQLLPRRSTQGNISKRAATWSGALLYSTLLKYEPEHPLVREAVREAVEDQMDGVRAQAEAARIFETPWELYHLPRPSPFALPLYVAYNRETLVAGDPEQALDDLVSRLYDQWDADADDQQEAVAVSKHDEVRRTHSRKARPR